MPCIAIHQTANLCRIWMKRNRLINDPAGRCLVLKLGKPYILTSKWRTMCEMAHLFQNRCKIGNFGNQTIPVSVFDLTLQINNDQVNGQTNLKGRRIALSAIAEKIMNWSRVKTITALSTIHMTMPTQEIFWSLKFSASLQCIGVFVWGVISAAMWKWQTHKLPQKW